MVTQTELEQAEQRTKAQQAYVRAIWARYDRRRRKVVVRLANGVELAFSPDIAQGLTEASPEALSVIELSPSGLRLHWPLLDADLYVPALMQGITGSPAWMNTLMQQATGQRPSPREHAA